MEIIYSTRRAILDVIDGQPNPFKEIIRDMREYQEEFEVVLTNDPDYQAFNIPEQVWIKYMTMKGMDYWEWIFNIAQACNASTFPKSKLSSVYCAIKADDAILEESVPTGLPMSSYLDENDQEVIHKFGSWYPDGIKPRANNKVVLLTMPHGDFLTDQQLLILKEFADNHPTLNIEFLHNAATQEELKNG